MSQYFYTRPGRIFGPVSSEDLRRLVASGVIRADDLVAKDGTSKFRVAIEIEGLAFAAPPTSPPPAATLASPVPPSPISDDCAGGDFIVDVDEPSPLNFESPIWSPPRASGKNTKRFGVGFVIAVVLGAPSGWLVAQLPPIQAWIARNRASIQRERVRQEVDRLHREAAEIRQRTGNDVRVVLPEETRKILEENSDGFSALGVDR